LNADANNNGLITYEELKDSIKEYDPPVRFTPMEK